MISLMKILIMSLILMTSKNSNPVKMSITLLLVSTLIFSTMAIEKANIWMPSIFYMLFMGGILIMFMILSSLNPNEKSKKPKNLMTSAMLISCIFFTLPKDYYEEMSMMLKSILNNTPSTLMFTFLIMIYFLSFISIMSKAKITLRSFECQK